MTRTKFNTSLSTERVLIETLRVLTFKICFTYMYLKITWYRTDWSLDYAVSLHLGDSRDS